MAAILVLTTAPDLKTARGLAKSLVEKKLAACVSLAEGFVSYYRWKGKVERVREIALLIKSSKEKFAQIRLLIKRIHPYEVPELIALPITQGSSEYLSWLNNALK